MAQVPDWQFIVVDDASHHEIADLCGPERNLTVIRNGIARGAGAARNIGLSHATMDFVVFWDDDDIMHWSVVNDIVSQMQANEAIDFAVSLYDFFFDGRHRPALHHDTKLIDALKCPEPRTDKKELRKLLHLTNFPWNKVFRRTFLQRCQLRFSETYVQNDILAHWKGILCADAVLVSSRIQCTKVQDSKGNRIGDTDDVRRVDSFVALRETYELVLSFDDKALEVEFWKFYTKIFRWKLTKTSRSIWPTLLKEHATFSAMLPGDLPRKLGSGNLKRWEVFDMDDQVVKEVMRISCIEDITRTGLEAREVDATAIYAEVCRLHRLASELKKENARVEALALHEQARAQNLEQKVRSLEQKVQSLERKLLPRLSRAVRSIMGI